MVATLTEEMKGESKMAEIRNCLVNLTGEKDGYIVETDGNDWYLSGKKEAVLVSESAAQWAINKTGYGTYEKVS